MSFNIIQIDQRMGILVKRSEVLTEIRDKISAAMGLRKDGKFQNTPYTPGDIFEWSKDVAWTRFFDSSSEKLKSLGMLLDEIEVEMQILTDDINVYMVTEKLKGD